MYVISSHLLFLQDTGISVRKRVIKIFREVFVESPDFNKIPDMCVKMIRRVNDEDGIKVRYHAPRFKKYFMHNSNEHEIPAKLRNTAFPA